MRKDEFQIDERRHVFQNLLLNEKVEGPFSLEEMARIARWIETGEVSPSSEK